MPSITFSDPRIPIFFAQYLTFFVGIVLICTFIDLSTVFDRRVSKYAKQSFKNLSDAIHRHRFKKDFSRQLSKERFQSLSLVEKVCRCCTTEVFRESQFESEKAQAEWRQWQQSHDTGSVNDEEDHTNDSFCCKSCYQPEKFSQYYFSELLKLNYLATVAFERGAAGDRVLILNHFVVHFAPGFLDDLMFYLMNNHSFLSMFLAVRGHPYSRFARRMTFLAVNCLVFFLVVLAAHAGALHFSSSAKTAVSVIISPVTIIARKWFYYMLACPCMRSNVESQHCCLQCWGNFCIACGRNVAFPILGLFLFFLLLAAAFTPYQDKNAASGEIGFYTQNIILASIAQEILHTLTVFWNGEACLNLYVCGLMIFGYGGYYRDKIRVLGLKGLRKNQYKLEYLQQRLERRQERKQREDQKSPKQEEVDDDSDNDEEQQQQSCDQLGRPVSVDSTVSSITMPSGLFSILSADEKSSSFSAASLSALSGKYDYVIYEVEWLKILSHGMLRAEFYVSVPFVKDLDKDLRDSTFNPIGKAYYEMADRDKSSSKSETFCKKDDFVSPSSQQLETQDHAANERISPKLIADTVTSPTP